MAMTAKKQEKMRNGQPPASLGLSSCIQSSQVSVHLLTIGVSHLSSIAARTVHHAHTLTARGRATDMPVLCDVMNGVRGLRVYGLGCRQKTRRMVCGSVSPFLRDSTCDGGAQSAGVGK